VEAGHCLFSFPAFTSSRPGDCAEISRTAEVLPGSGRYVLRFEEYDNYTGPTAGYHLKQLLIGNRVVWESDVAGGGKGWHEVECDVSRFIRGKREVKLRFRGIDRKGVSQFGVEIGFRELAAEGLELGTSNFGVQEGWHVYVRGRWRVSFHPERGGLRWFNIPLVVMTAGSMWEYLIRRGMTRAEAREAVREMTDAAGGRLRIPAPDEALLCGCGRFGCNEALYSGGAVRRKVKGLMRRIGRAIPQGMDPCAFLNQEVGNGEPWALELYEEVGRGIGRAGANMLNRISKIEKIVYMGTFAMRGMCFMRETIKETIRRRAMYEHHKDIPIEPSCLWSRGALLGVAYLFRN
jgi:hypothetical protein